MDWRAAALREGHGQINERAERFNRCAEAKRAPDRAFQHAAQVALGADHPWQDRTVATPRTRSGGRGSGRRTPARRGDGKPGCATRKSLGSFRVKSSTMLASCMRVRRQGTLTGVPMPEPSAEAEGTRIEYRQARQAAHRLVRQGMAGVGVGARQELLVRRLLAGRRTAQRRTGRCPAPYSIPVAGLTVDPELGRRTPCADLDHTPRYDPAVRVQAAPLSVPWQPSWNGFLDHGPSTWGTRRLRERRSPEFRAADGLGPTGFLWASPPEPGTPSARAGRRGA